ncbi:LpqB family beta-propeller domain-containing protein [Micromonospora sp. NPDC003197]
MTRRLLTAATAATILVTGVAGCGIPDETGVQISGPGPAQKYGADAAIGGQPPDRLDSLDDSKQFVSNLLAAAAGETSGAYGRVAAFIVPNQRGAMKEKQGSDVAINVVRPIEETPRSEEQQDGINLVTIRVQQVGVLRADGTLTAPVATETSYTFRVGRDRWSGETASQGLYLLDPPPALLMSTQALKTYYQQQTIYFWNADRTALVPDLRYLPLALPRQGRANTVLDWLTGGPADWLTAAALRLPEGTDSIGNVLQNGDRIEVNLSTLAGPDEEAELHRLAVQLAWSLQDLSNEIELKIRNQSREMIDVPAYREENKAYQLDGNALRFCVYDDSVHALLDSGTSAASVPIAEESNRNVVSAALNRGGAGVLAALVTKTGNDRRRLSTGTGKDLVQTFAQSPETYETMSRPVWLKGTEPGQSVGLVVADGTLYRFGTDAKLTEVRVPNAPADVSAVGASLDGHRIAFIAGGDLYVAAMTVDNGIATPGPARRLVTSLGELSAVEWSGENSLVVAGVRSRPAIYEITVDGALELTFDNDTETRVTHLATYPNNPVVPPSLGRVMYEANSIARADRFSTFERIGPDQVADRSTGSPTGSHNPSAPFFFY